jgi:hypothetical protein
MMIKNQLYGLLIIGVVFTSCGFTKTMKQYNLQSINAQKQYIVIDQTFKSIDKHHKVDSSLPDISLHGLFNRQALKNSPITLAFTTNNELQVKYQDSVATKTLLLKGRFTKAGYFKTRIKTKNIFIPLFYSNRQMEKYKLCLSESGDLVLKFNSIHEGNILLFAAGNSYSKRYFFKRVE